MATFTTNVSLDMSLPGYFYNVTASNLILANSTEIRTHSPDGDTQSYQGHFAYYSNGSLNWSASTLNAIVEYLPTGAVAGSVTGMNVSGSTYYNYAISNNLTGLKTYAFSGADTLNGSAFGDVLLGYAGNDLIYGNSGNDVLDGGAGDDTLAGGDGNDYLTGGTGNDGILGGAGLDTVAFAGNLSDHVVTVQSNGYTNVVDKSVSRDGGDVLNGVERLKFADYSLALDAEGAAGQAYRLYKAAFDRVPDYKGLGYWISAMDNGNSPSGIGSSFVASPEFQAMYGANSTNDAFVTLLYQHVLHRAPDAAGLAYWNTELNSGHLTRGGVLASFSESTENHQQVASLIANGIQYQDWPA